MPGQHHAMSSAGTFDHMHLARPCAVRYRIGREQDRLQCSGELMSGLSVPGRTARPEMERANAARLASSSAPALMSVPANWSGPTKRSPRVPLIR